MSGLLAWVVVAVGLVVVVIRRRSAAVALVTVEAILLAIIALVDAHETAEVVAAVALLVRGLGLAGLFFVLIRSTRERLPVSAYVGPSMRASVAVVFALLLTWLMPSFGLESRDAERAVLGLLAFGVAIVATRRATLFLVLGIVTVENALALAALSQPGGSSLVIELGVTLDLLLIAAVAAVFHRLIFAHFGAGDSAALRSLHDR
jgi:hydrogenase-4 membrane subunit HyfE